MDLLTILSYTMVVVFLILIMTKKVSPFTGLVAVPVVFGIIGAFLNIYTIKDNANPTILDNLIAVGEWGAEGIGKVANTGVMLLFAILFFSIMLDAGLFDSVTRAMIRFAKGDPVKVLVAAAFLSFAVSWNGDGTTTTLIVCTAFVPLFKALKMKLMNLAVVIIMMNTIMNLLPWGGPSARVISILEGVDPNVTSGNVLNALIPGMVVSIIFMFGAAVYMGLKERKRLGVSNYSSEELLDLIAEKDPERIALKRPQLLLFNAVLTISLITLLIMDKVPSSFLFMLGTVIALMVNYPKQKDQKNRISDNAGDAVQVVILVFGAGIFTGIFTGTGMSDALATNLASLIPTSAGPFWGLIVAILSAPGTFFLSNDAFYYGVLPVVNQVGNTYGFTALEIGVASLLGQAFHLLSPLVAFIYLLLNRTEQDLGEWQKEAAKYAFWVFVIFIAVAGILNIVPLVKY